MARYQSYIICTSPRSGSTLLCGLLAATGKSGKPDSHFHTPSVSDWLKKFELSAEQFAGEHDALNAIFDAARKLGTGKTGMFGLRLQRKSFDYFIRQLHILHPGLDSDTDRVQAAFRDTLFIHLTRGDKLEQAISLVKATQTGLWHRAPDGTELERLSEPREPVYNGDEIARHRAEFIRLDENWTSWFREENLSPLRVTYDELAADPAAVLARILDELGLDREIAHGIPAPVAKLADATNRAWAERFLAEGRDRSEPPP